MKIENRNKIIWALVSIVALGVAFLIIRFALFEIHMMMQWPVILFVAGLVFIGISAIVGTWKVMIGTVVGYIVGFVLGMVIFVDVRSFDPNSDSYRYYGWWIWLLSYLVCVIIGVAWSFISRKRSN